MTSLTTLLAHAQTPADYQILKNEKPLRSAAEGAAYFGIDAGQTAPTLIIEAGGNMYACIVSGGRKKIDFQRLAKSLGHPSAALADRHLVKNVTGYDVGFVPMIGLKMPYVLDTSLLQFDYVYGGTGQPDLTLKIRPQCLIKQNAISYWYE